MHERVPPPFGYYGGKYYMARWINERLPWPVERYGEPFGGAANVLLQRRPAKEKELEAYNDLNGALANFFRIVGSPEACDELIRMCRWTLRSRDTWKEACEAHRDGDGVRRAWGTLHAYRFGYGGKGTKGFCYSAIGKQSAFLANLERIRARFADVIVESMDWADFVTKHERAGRTLFYVDPPYLGDVRSGGEAYGVDMMDESCHVRLLQWAVDTECMVAISGYPSELYDNALADWDRQEHRVVASVSMSSGDRARTEVLWRNHRCVELLEAGQPSLGLDL